MRILDSRAREDRMRSGMVLPGEALRHAHCQRTSLSPQMLASGLSDCQSDKRAMVTGQPSEDAPGHPVVLKCG